ncbi:MAG: hypothetical protein GEV05_27425 [Betaproteobacteria bacterium]|nr:hypothetical protein [Betaproteobacteria bacterium]
MFSSLKDGWALSKIAASIEGVVRETEKGNGTAVKQWYFDYLRYTREYGIKTSFSEEQIVQRAMKFTPARNLQPFREIVKRLIQPGELLHDIHKEYSKIA